MDMMVWADGTAVGMLLYAYTTVFLMSCSPPPLMLVMWNTITRALASTQMLYQVVF